ATGPATPLALPPENPPPPTPSKRPFQPVIGRPIQIRTRSFAGGCVSTAVTRQAPFCSAADSIVVFGRVTEVRLAQVRTGGCPQHARVRSMKRIVVRIVTPTSTPQANRLPYLVMRYPA